MCLDMLFEHLLFAKGFFFGGALMDDDGCSFPEDCAASVTAHMDHSKCNDVSVGLLVSGGRVLIPLMCVIFVHRCPAK